MSSEQTQPEVPPAAEEKPVAEETPVESTTPPADGAEAPKKTAKEKVTDKLHAVQDKVKTSITGAKEKVSK